MKEYKYKINGKEYKVAVGEREEQFVTVEVNGTAYSVELEEAAPAPAPKVVRPAEKVEEVPVAAPTQVAAPAAGGSAIKSPLPGVILSINVKVGDAVKRGQTLLVLEAMKMENDIKADRDGVINAVCVRQNDSILEGTDLIIIG